MKPHTRVIGVHIQTGEMIHESVIDRINDNAQPAYKPDNVLGSNEKPELVQDKGRDYIVVNGNRVPIFKERDNLRIWADQAEGRIAVAGEQTEICWIIDFTKARGARLRINGSINAGVRLRLESDVTGGHDTTVVWCRSGEVGVRFVV